MGNSAGVIHGDIFGEHIHDSLLRIARGYLMSLTKQVYTFDTSEGEKHITATDFVAAVKQLAKKHPGISIWKLVREAVMSPEGGRA